MAVPTQEQLTEAQVAVVVLVYQAVVYQAATAVQELLLFVTQQHKEK
jgi:hypothetical protein